MRQYNKLVRDKIPDIMIKNGSNPVITTLSDTEYFKCLNNKLKEEVNEYLEDFSVVELADIEEVIRAILKYKKVSYEEFEKIRQDKALQRGSFDQRIFLESDE